MLPCDGLASRVQFNAGKRTTILQLSFKQFDHSLRVTLFLLVILDHLAELSDPSVEWAKVDLVVHPRLVHVVQNLLHGTWQISVTVSRYQAHTECEGRVQRRINSPAWMRFGSKSPGILWSSRWS